MRKKSIFSVSAAVAIASASLLTFSAVAKQNDECVNLKGQERATCVHERGVKQKGHEAAGSARSVASLSPKQQKVKLCRQVLKEWTKQRNQAHKEWHKNNKVGGGNQAAHKEWHKQKIAELKVLLKAIKAGNCASLGSSSMASSKASSASSASSTVSSTSASSASSRSSTSSVSSGSSTSASSQSSSVSSSVSSTSSSAQSSVASSTASSALSSSVNSSVASSVSSGS